jgi:hypothetical protein
VVVLLDLVSLLLALLDDETFQVCVASHDQSLDVPDTNSEGVIFIIQAEHV